MENDTAFAFQKLDVYVAALRRKLGPDVIETVRGRGYRLRPRAAAAEVAR